MAERTPFTAKSFGHSGRTPRRPYTAVGSCQSSPSPLKPILRDITLLTNVRRGPATSWRAFHCVIGHTGQANGRGLDETQTT